VVVEGQEEEKQARASAHRQAISALFDS